MLKTVATGLVAYTLVFAVNSASAGAATLDIPTTDVNNSAAGKLTALVEKTQKEEEPVETEQIVEVTKHTVLENESLTDIAEIYEITWNRIYDKNKTIESPDIITPGDELVIPSEDEELETRELPVAPEPIPTQATTTSTAAVTQTDSQPRSAAAVTRPASVQVQQSRGASAGNRYSYGYCTWHVKNLRSDLPNNLGNANTWVSRARAQGMATGSTPRVGAVAEATTGYMHVAYVTGVNGDGTVNLSEMNFKGFGVASTRTAPANQFVYIY